MKSSSQPSTVPRTDCIHLGEQVRTVAIPQGQPKIGTAMKAILAEYGIHPSGCGCGNEANAMDAHGPVYVQNQRGDLVARIAQRATERGWLATIGNAGLKHPLLALGLLWKAGTPSLAGLIEALLDAAVERANAAVPSAELTVLGCNVFVECTQNQRVDGVAGCCQGCGRYRSRPTADAIRWAERIEGVEDWPEKWESLPDVQSAHRLSIDRKAKEFVAAECPVAFSGNGIVTSGGGVKYFTSAYVMVYILRKLGCTLPVEWWHIGWQEMDDRMRMLAESLGNVRVVNALDVAKTLSIKPRYMGGWRSKPFSIMHSRFESVLYLDADQVPTRDPAYLFDDLPNGAILWPDLENNLGYDCTTLFFDVLGLPSPGNGGDLWSKPRHGYRPVESGQVLIDKRRRWQELLLVDWLADHEDFFYRPPRGKHKWLAYGDKSCFLGGFWRTSLERDGGIDYFTPSNHSMPPDCTWIGNNSGGAFLQRDLAGEIVFAHRCQPTSKLSLHGKNTHPNGFPNAALIDEAIANLRGKWLGRPWDWSDQDGPDNDVARAACGEWVLFRGSETPIKLALQDGGAVNGEWHWTIRHYAKEPYLIVSDKTAGRFLFGNSEGSWCSHDTGTFLYPAPPKDFACPSDIESVSICYGVMSLNEYGLPKHFSGGDVIVDVGAHIGSFAYACHQRGARIIHAVEPDADNFRSLEKNAGGKAKLYRLAAWRSDEPSRWLKLCRPDGAKHSGGGTVVESLTGQEVLAVPFDQIMDIATEHGQRRVTLLKLDCEQSEWPILETSKRLDLVDMIVGEWHGRSADEMLQLLSSRGFQYVGADKHHSAPRLGHFWASRTKRRVVVVSGAASSGNHLHEAILKAAGCIDVRYALPISKDSLPKWSLPVTWLRSVPHGKEATDINALVNMLRDSECEVLAIVPQRRRDVVVKSQLANGHVASRDEAERWCAKADKLSEQFAALGVPCFASQYEELVADPAAHVKRLCEFAGLQVPQINFEIYNGNLKWEVAQNTPSTITA